MSQRTRELERNNRYVDRPFAEAGLGISLSPRREVEDRLIQCLEDCITADPPGLLPCRIDWFREFVRANEIRLGWPRRAVTAMLSDDQFCATSVLYWAARLKRMINRHQWACNKLLERGFTIERLPDGNEEL